jgi:S1-C subfamily serine protease
MESLTQQPVIAADVGISYDMNTLLMKTTFRIEGSGSVGTGFVLGKNVGDSGRYVLVTAAHVLEDIKEEFAHVHFRIEKTVDEWKRIETALRIRSNGKPLWTKHPDADVAVMYIGVPTGAIDGVIGTPLLANDEMLRRYEVHPGDALNCLGFPLGFESSEVGFPVLRSGKIASYPLVPTKQTKTFLIDIEVFPGNSGGPVFFTDSNRHYKGTKEVHIGETTQFLMGLVSEEMLLEQNISELYAKRLQRYPLKLAKVVHASLIREAIELLPEP